MGTFLRDVMKLNMEARNFRLFSPDENNSNRWQDALESPIAPGSRDRILGRPPRPRAAGNGDAQRAPVPGLARGLLLTGRHGFFSCYEAFIHIIDSMFNQHAKWLKVCNEIPWRRPIGSLNYLLSSHVWRQDHNGFSHQDRVHRPSSVKRAEVVRVYLPPDANAHGHRPLPAQPELRQRRRCRQAAGAAVADHGRGDQALRRRPGIWEWASNDRGAEPDVVMACCGDVPTLETLPPPSPLRRHAPS